MWHQDKTETVAVILPGPEVIPKEIVTRFSA